MKGANLRSVIVSAARKKNQDVFERRGKITNRYSS